MDADPNDLTLSEKINAAFQQATMRVIERARQTGTPVIFWENEQISERTSDDVEHLLQGLESDGRREIQRG